MTVCLSSSDLRNSWIKIPSSCDGCRHDLQDGVHNLAPDKMHRHGGGYVREVAVRLRAPEPIAETSLYASKSASLTRYKMADTYRFLRFRARQRHTLRLVRMLRRR